MSMPCLSYRMGGYGFEVLNREAVLAHAERYSPAFGGYSPWKTDFEAMAMKTAIKKVLKFAPLKTDFTRVIATDESIKNEIAIDMAEVAGERYIEEGDSDGEASV